MTTTTKLNDLRVEYNAVGITERIIADVELGKMYESEQRRWQYRQPIMIERQLLQLIQLSDLLGWHHEPVVVQLEADQVFGATQLSRHHGNVEMAQVQRGGVFRARALDYLVH